MLLQLAQGLTGFTSYSTAYTVPATVNTGNVYTGTVTNRSYQNVIQYFISVDEIKYLQGGKSRTLLRTVLYENTQRSPKN